MSDVRMITMNDMAGVEVVPGDILTDGRGLLYRVEETPGSFQAQLIASTTPMAYTGAGLRETARPAIYARLTLMAKITPKRQDEAAREWREIWERARAPGVRTEIKSRRQRVAAVMPKKE